MRFLVTAIGSFSADCVIKTLKKNGGYVIGCDIYKDIWHAASKNCDVFYQSPYATEEEIYIKFLLDIIEKEKIKYLIPLTDIEIDVINRHRNIFSKTDILLCIQSEKCLQIARNKYNLCKLFQEDKVISIPPTIRSEDLSNAENPLLCFPLIAKPIDGRSSEGLYHIYSKEELAPFHKRNNYIIQKMLKGSVYTVDYVRDGNGNDYSIPREELLRTKNGAGTTVRIFTDKTIQETVSYIGNKLGVIGCINMEFIHSNGIYYLIDINPRFSAGVAFSNNVGYDMVTNHINCFIGKKILPPITYKEQIQVKRYVEEQIWIQK